MNEYEQDADGYWSAASGRSPYRPATALTIEQWSDRHQDALRPVQTDPLPAVSEAGLSPQEPNIGSHEALLPTRLSRTRSCRVCGDPLTGYRADAKVCRKPRCRRAIQRAKVTV
jgi:hypothetical protein